MSQQANSEMEDVVMKEENEN